MIKTILTFWFHEVTPEQRFAKDDELDNTIRERFESIYWSILKRETFFWKETAEGALAEIIVLDQFARNMFRGAPQSFAGDPLALELAMEMVGKGQNKELPVEQRSFVYMPFMHSESNEVHKQTLRLFEELGNENNLKYEHWHKSIIDRFGRYPHRNKVLGRESTSEEEQFLKEFEGF